MPVTVELSIENQIVAAIRRIIQAVELNSRRLVEEIGLTGPQLAVLREAARRGPLPVGALARGVHLSQPTVTGVLNRLEKRGLVQRVRRVDDRRAVNVNVTEAGQVLAGSAPSLLQDSFHRKLGDLQPWEQTMILAILQRIAGMMDAETLDASPLLVTGSVTDAGAGPADPAEGSAAPTQRKGGGVDAS
jgi:DNA-binding MarR family transcriptional regulator